MSETMHFVPLESSRLAPLIAVPTLMLLLAWTTTMLRCWVKKQLLNTFAWDDWLMLLALAVFTAMAILVYIAAANGTGKHMYELPLENIIFCLHLWVTGVTVYLITSVLIKASISIFLLRLAVEKWQKCVVWATLVIYTITSIGFLANAWVQCKPVAYTWDKTIPGGTCKDPQQFTNASNANAALTTATDLVYALLPIWMIRKVQMNLQTKISVAMILSCGLLSTTATAVRFPYIYRLGLSEDFLYDFYGLEIWSTIEPGLGIAAASAATLRPLLRKLTSLGNTVDSSRGGIAKSSKEPLGWLPEPKGSYGSKGYIRSHSPDFELEVGISSQIRGGEGVDSGPADRYLDVKGCHEDFQSRMSDEQPLSF